MSIAVKITFWRRTFTSHKLPKWVNRQNLRKGFRVSVMYILEKRRGLPLKKVVIAVRSAWIYVAFIAGSNLDWWFMFIIKKVWYCISFSLLSPSQVKLICMIFIFLLIRWKQVEMKRTFLFGSCLMVPTLMIPPHVQLVKKLNLTCHKISVIDFF